jgi:transporter family protein
MQWLIYALLSALFAGFVGIFGKLGMRDIDSTVATAARSVIMAIALSLLVAATGNLGALKNIGSRSWIFIALAGFAGAASWLCYFRALQIGDAIQVAPIDKLSVVVTVILGVLILGEKLTIGIFCGAALILAGSLLVICG